MVAEGVIDMCAYRTMCKAMQKHLGYTLKMARLRLPPCSRLSRCTSPRDVPPSTRVFLACAPHVAAPRRPAALRESAAWPSSSSPTTRSTCRSSSAFARSSSSCGTSPSSSTTWVCCTPGWNRSVLDVTFLRRYSAAPVWDELREALALDPQRRRPLLMWQRHSRHPWLCPCRDRSVGRLFGSIVRSSLNIRIRWRPPSAHQAAAAAGRAIGAPHRYHRSAPSQCSTA